MVGLPEGQRSLRYHQAPFFGEAGVGHARAYPYIRVGRIRLLWIFRSMVRVAREGRHQPIRTDPSRR